MTAKSPLEAAEGVSSEAGWHPTWTHRCTHETAAGSEKWCKSRVITGFFLAEDGGFEPPRAFTQHAFQACAIGH